MVSCGKKENNQISVSNKTEINKKTDEGNTNDIISKEEPYLDSNGIKYYSKDNNENITEGNSLKKEDNITETDGSDTGYAIMVDGAVYYDTGIPASPIDYRLFVGIITSECAKGTVPTEHQQSNFGTGYEYQTGESEGQIKVQFESGTCVIFATEEEKKEMTE